MLICKLRVIALEEIMSYTPRCALRGQGIALIALGLLLLVTGAVLPYRLMAMPVISVLGFLILLPVLPSRSLAAHRLVACPPGWNGGSGAASKTVDP
jgi:hypothetical protein